MLDENREVVRTDDRFIAEFEWVWQREEDDGKYQKVVSKVDQEIQSV